MSPTVRRRILLVSLVAVCALAVMAGCAVNDQGWETKPATVPLAALFVDSTPAEIARHCPPRPGYVMHGCAVRRQDLNICFIYVEPDVPKWLATHELFHCSGFNHPQ